jgi:hypothetical protein
MLSESMIEFRAYIAGAAMLRPEEDPDGKLLDYPRLRRELIRLWPLVRTEFRSAHVTEIVEARLDEALVLFDRGERGAAQQAMQVLYGVLNVYDFDAVCAPVAPDADS